MKLFCFPCRWRNLHASIRFAAFFVMFKTTFFFRLASLSPCLAAALFLAAAGPLPAAKVRLPANPSAARTQALPGIDYGSFYVVDVDDATADWLVRSNGGEVLPEADRILLNAETVDTTTPAAKALRSAAVGGSSGKRLHLVQFAGPIKQEWVDALEADGLQVVTYIPNNAYLVWGESAGVARLQSRAADVKKSAVQWEAPWQDNWKLAPSVLADEKSGREVARLLSVQLVADKEANDLTLAALRAAGAYFLRDPWTSPGYVNFDIQLAPSALGVLTARPDVVSIHRHYDFTKKDESQARVLAGAISGNAPTAGNYLSTLAGWGFTQAQFDASGLAVDVSDDGVDNGTTTPNHFVLYKNGDKTQASRFIYRVTQGTSGTDGGVGNSGHGQLNTSIIGGFVPNTSVTVNGNTTPTTTFPHADAQGFRYGLGIAPFVKLGNSTIFDPSFTSPNYATLQSAAYAAGARVSSNSWGSDAAGAYTSDAQSYDNLVRDAQSGTAGNQGMVIVFSAGNAGSGAGTIGAPGSAKNIICVGAAEGVRSHALAAGGLDAAGNDGCAITDAGADSINDIATFSSRGPCKDGRIKPDLVAGGTHITGMTYVTATSTQNGTAATTYRADGVCGLSGNTATTGQVADFFPTANSGAAPYNQAQKWWSTSSGTSHSCPAVSGAAALVFQQFLNNPSYLATNRTPAGAAPPSPALVKGYLLNSTRFMTGLSANDALPSNSQGMGHANLGTAFDGVTRIIRDQVPADRFTATGQTRSFTATVADTSKPLRVTLAWTDKAGATSGNAYVNNLDLTVTVGGTTYKGNVFAAGTGLSAAGGTADPRNNVESVFLPAGTSGSFTVTVNATNIAGQADATVTGNNQDFALVVYNGNPAILPSLSAGTPALGNTGLLAPNDCNTLTLPVSNVGTAGATNLSAVLSTSTAGVTITQANSTYPDLAAGATGSNATAFRVSTAALVPCGTQASFTLTVTYTGGGSPSALSFTLPVGSDTTNYTFNSSTGATIPAGGTLVAGSAADDALVSVTAPFAFSVYGTNVEAGTVLRACTNGNLQFVASGGTTALTNTALPASTFGATPTLLPYWDDLLLTTTGGGIYTNTVGAAPYRQWVVEWRGRAYTSATSTTQTLNFAVVFTEGASGFKFLYPQIADTTGANGSSATVGVQATNTGTQSTQYSFNTASITSGLVLTAALPTCVSGSGPCATGTPPAITSAAPASPVIVGTAYSHTFTATGTPAPTFAVTAGSLPPGLVLSSAGVLSGTATSAGTGSFPGITVTASNGNAPAATQTFSLSVVTRAANYFASYGLTGADAAPDADPNGDGVTNLLAYALGLNPTQNNSVFDHGTVRDYRGASYLSIRFTRSAVATDLTYIVEAANDLTGTWTELARSTAGGAMTAANGVVVSDAGGPPAYTTEVRDTVALPSTDANPKRFLRLRVTTP